MLPGYGKCKQGHAKSHPLYTNRLDRHGIKHSRHGNRHTRHNLKRTRPLISECLITRQQEIRTVWLSGDEISTTSGVRVSFLLDWNASGFENNRLDSRLFSRTCRGCMTIFQCIPIQDLSRTTTIALGCHHGYTRTTPIFQVVTIRGKTGTVWLRLTVLFVIATASLLLTNVKTTWPITNSFCTYM
jgi:hypothetical protein